MDFKIKHVLKEDRDRVAAVLLDEAYQTSLSDIGPLRHRELLAQDENSDGTVSRRIRCVLDVEIKGVAKSLLGGGEPAWVEESTWHPDEWRWEWDIHPEVGKELLDASGTIDLIDEGSSTLRLVDGVVKVSVPLYGGRVEGWIVEGLEAAYDEEADRLAEWLSEHD